MFEAVVDRISSYDDIPPCDATVRSWIAALGAPAPDLDDAARIDLIRALEDLKSAAAAAQARLSMDLDASQRDAQRAAGVPPKRRGAGVAAQVALARRESPARGGRYLGLARALVTEMPHTLAALSSGVLSEWRATLLVRESACLSREDRAALDREICGDVGALVGVGDQALVARARAVAVRLDQASVVARARRAEAERCVTLRPAPDTMTYFTALLPVTQGVATYAALTRCADSARAAGDPRSRGQVMADEFVARIVDPAASEAGSPGDRRPTRLELQLVMTDRTLLAGDDEPARLAGYGTVPGAWARGLVLDMLDSCRTGGRGTGAGPLGRMQVWVRRLFTAPTTGQLVTMDSRARLAPTGLADLIRTRDGSCRTPWCDAPVRHIDHVESRASGGPTCADNLQGTCESCNYAKAAPGWRAAPVPRDPADPQAGAPPDVVTETPTGHRYLSRAPALPGRVRRAPAASGQGIRSATGRRRRTEQPLPHASRYHSGGASPRGRSARRRGRPLPEPP